MFFAHAAISFPMQMFSLPCSGYNVSFCRALFTIVFVLTVIKTYVDKNKRVKCIVICLGRVHTHILMSTFDLCVFRYMFVCSVCGIPNHVGWLCLSFACVFISSLHLCLCVYVLHVDSSFAGSGSWLVTYEPPRLDLSLQSSIWASHGTQNVRASFCLARPAKLARLNQSSQQNEIV